LQRCKKQIRALPLAFHLVKSARVLVCLAIAPAFPTPERTVSCATACGWHLNKSWSFLRCCIPTLHHQCIELFRAVIWAIQAFTFTNSLIHLFVGQPCVWQISKSPDFPKENPCQRVIVPLVTLPKDQTSDLRVAGSPFKTSGAVHLIGISRTVELYVPSCTIRDSPKSLHLSRT
jgi:hypothetical protein